MLKYVTYSLCKKTLLFPVLTFKPIGLYIISQAPPEEINSAYRRFSRMFHPDKHSTDPNKQKWAEQIFNKVKEAYEVLSDSHKRAIYDTLGKIIMLNCPQS